MSNPRPVPAHVRDSATFVEVLDRRVSEHGDRLAFRFLLDEGSAEELTYSELDRHARRVAAALRAALPEAPPAGRPRALMFFPAGLDFIVGFFGCLRAGVIAVPAYPPTRAQPAQGASRLTALLRSAEPAAVLATTEVSRQADALYPLVPGLDRLPWLEVDELRRRGAPVPSGATPELAPDDVAFIQYTSGSTTAPRGVMVSHANLIHNQRTIQTGFDVHPDDVCVSWLPLYHDMGLIGMALGSIYNGVRTTLMSPLRFMRSPLTWLRAITEERATISGAPNFAYELCVDRISAAQRRELDLSSWRVAFSGAEPVRPSTLARFRDAFAGAGFSGAAFVPCYGLAEATLMVSSHRPGAPTLTADSPDMADGGRPLVSCGPVVGDQQVLVVDPDTMRVCEPGRVGELWIRGGNVALGYWRDPERTAATFGARTADGEGPFLRTGDLGVLHAGELYVTGRCKDLIIIRGRNLYPQDVEELAERSHPACVAGGCAAIAIDPDGNGERLAVVQEVYRAGIDAATLDAAVSAIRAVVARELGIEVYAVALVKSRTIPRTTSGKIRRAACRAAFEAGALAALADDRHCAPARDARPMPTPQALRAMTADDRRAALTSAVTALVAATAGDRAALAEDAPLIELGLDSLRVVELQAALEDRLAVTIDIGQQLDGMTLGGLIDRCLAALVDDARANGPSPLALDERAPRPTSYAQQSIWLASQLSADSAAYAIPLAVALNGPLDPDLLRAALDTIAVRHEILRTTFREHGGRVLQRVHGPTRMEVPLDDWRGGAPEAGGGAPEAGGGAPEAGEDALHRLAVAEVRAPWDLAAGPLVRMRIVQRGARSFALLGAMHHIIADGWSMGLAMAELGALYAELGGGPPAALPALPYQYAAFAAWQREQLRGPALTALIAHWRGALAGLPRELLLPGVPAGRAAHAHGGEGHTLRRTIAPALAAALTATCRRTGVTPFTLLLAALDTLIYRSTGQADLPIGVATLGRTAPGTDRIIGNFVNMVVIRVHLDGNPRFVEVVDRVRRAAREALTHQHLPYDLLVSDCLPDGGTRTPFRIGFGTQNLPRAPLRLPGMTVEPIHVDPGMARFELSLWASETPVGLELVWTYASELYTEDAVAALHHQLLALLADALERPDTRIASLALAPPRASTSPGEAAPPQGPGLTAPAAGRRRGPVRVRATELVTTRLASTAAGEALPYPLIIEPRDGLAGELDPAAWARANRGWLMDAIARHGGALLRGFALPDIAAFTALVRASAGDPLAYQERSSPRDVIEGEIYTSTSHPADQEIFVHNEQSYNLTFPRLIYFYCQTPARERGATPIASTRRVMQALPPALVDRFSELGYLYLRNFGGGFGLPWQVAFQTSERAEVDRYCRDNEITATWLPGDRLRTAQVRRCVARHPVTGEQVWFNHATFFHVTTLAPEVVASLRGQFSEREMPNNVFYGDGREIEPEVMDTLRAAYVDARIALPWQQHDCLILDNMLMAHGREPFRGERRIAVAMAEPHRWADLAILPSHGAPRAAEVAP